MYDTSQGTVASWNYIFIPWVKGKREEIAEVKLSSPCPDDLEDQVRVATGIFLLKLLNQEESLGSWLRK